jgi:hypothetical protein
MRKRPQLTTPFKPAASSDTTVVKLLALFLDRRLSESVHDITMYPLRHSGRSPDDERKSSLCNPSIVVSFDMPASFQQQVGAEYCGIYSCSASSLGVKRPLWAAFQAGPRASGSRAA